MVYFSGVALPAVSGCYLSPSDRVVHVGFGAWWAILPGGQGKQLTLQPKFTTAGLSCPLPVCIDKKASEKEGRWKWVRQLSQCC